MYILITIYSTFVLTSKETCEKYICNESSCLFSTISISYLLSVFKTIKDIRSKEYFVDLNSLKDNTLGRVFLETKRFWYRYNRYKIIFCYIF